ncbi:hypothetical protein GGS23DRAFT_548750 [Durotheca rogersii]|uniref:uncharacterized protein n=1 Tax=Durotheca rogersii TaxID=419775 RepID=UPI00221F9688|nr:uncharacterized protein GGS23DRAFT_548750 [Durotheca rogersii]KAI5867527.1 hypothetical protein GGS23DRAFT_548750 [Durotheca rogersii]
MSPTREQILETAKLFLQSFNEFSEVEIVRYCSPNCRIRLLPASLKQPVQGPPYLSAMVKMIQAQASAFRLSIIEGEEPAVDVVTRKVTMHLESYSEMKAGVYQNEYIWIVTVSEDGKTVDDLIEFADSAYTAEWLPKILAAAQPAPQA